MPTQLAIIADDLTGAADSAARCYHAGLAATIALAPPTTPLATVTAFTSDSRHLESSTAAEHVQRSVFGLRNWPELIWYKKIDSTLRGHLGAELDAILQTLERKHAVICPAFPAQGRGLSHGTLLLSPPHQAPPHLPTLLAAQSQRPVAAVSLEDVRVGTPHLATKLVDAAQTAALLVIDGTTDADLHTIVAATQQALPDALFCGSAGLVGALAQRYASHAPPTFQRESTFSAPESVLLVIGSGSQMARQQIKRAAQHGARIHTIGDVLEAEFALMTVLCLPEATPQDVLDGPPARRLAEQLAAVAAEHIAQHAPELLVLSGGDTAMAVLQRLGVTRLDVVRELLPGVPLTRGVDQNGRHYAVVLKAGNHGAEDALVRIVLAGSGN